MSVVDPLPLFFGLLLTGRAAARAMVLLRRDRVPASGRRVDPCLGPVWGLPPKPAEPDRERVLFDRLRTGRISKARYRAAMAELAAGDERGSRHHHGSDPAA
ncbi:hypothetical protein BJY16_006383 [Actinoplanes octamycinicus]|uniref:Uncharacterized protein n=1 Tax=Actinoplanes octamycinicus TaxID=135948 RepID=A0A7W7MAD6_9ACTN|nr:hypothetical protein [Actinoplanes octamycinicus]MBB4742924.1 hypothetical protein [Actinoplanes octamycinicus]GIE58224.1 hypothetical protein Aoc01nite_36260 [Actinoplanes octamycinicus]